MIENKVITVSVEEQSLGTVDLGFQGENLARSQSFDFSAWVEAFGSGNITLLVQRSGDSEAYPVVLSIDGNIATWAITETDTAHSGRGWCQLLYFVGDVQVKDETLDTYTHPSLGEGDVPEPYEGFLEQVTEIAAQVSTDAAAAEAAAEMFPPGGTTGQVLTKRSDADYDASWIDPQGGGGGSLPPGGTEGQYLRKNSSVEGDASWAFLPVYDGSYEVTPLIGTDTVMATSQRYLDRNVVLKAIPYQEVSNQSGGKTATIGG